MADSNRTAYIQRSVSCSLGLLGCGCCSIDGVCDVLVGVDGVSGVADLRTPARILHRAENMSENT